MQPTASPGTLSGKVMRRKLRHAVARSVRAASSILGSIRPSADATGNTIIGKKTCSEPITTAVSEYSSVTGFFAKPVLSSTQSRMPVGPFPRINCQP